MKLKIDVTGVLGSNRIVSTPLMLILPLIIIFQEFEAVWSLPVKMPGIEPGLPSQGEGEEEERGRPVEGRRRDFGLVGENETAAGVIYDVNEPLIHEFPDWLVEMDIVRSPIVEEILRHGIDERPTTAVDPEGGGDLGDDSDSEGGEDMAGATRVEHREKKAPFNAQLHNYLYWPDARIPYAFHPYIDAATREAVWSAMDHWMAHTCIKFVEREPDEEDYVKIITMTGCWSYVGKQGGDQKLSVGVGWQPYCKYKGVLIHELGHSIGFWHEQTRPDRDRYVRIVWENMINTAYQNFLRYSTSQVDSLSVPYDYASIMHYPSNAFTKNGKATIVALEPGVTVMGQRNSLSPLDIKQANLLYNCKVMNNETDITDTHLNLIDPIPPNAYQIFNAKTNSCLTSLKVETNADSEPPANLYNVSTARCNSSLSQQFWQWTENDTILNIGSYLCLTTVGGSGTGSDGGSGIEKLALAPCMVSDNRQKWSCAGSFIQQPTSGKCLTTSDVSNGEGGEGLGDEAEQSQTPDEHSSESSDTSHSEMFINHMNDISKRDTYLHQIVDELDQFLYDNNDDDDDEDDDENTDTNDNSDSTNHDDNIDIAHETNGTANVLTPVPVTAQYCTEQDKLQMWIGVPRNPDNSAAASSSTSETSICSLNGTTGHNLPRCYTNDMETIISMLSSYNWDVSEWITCEKHGYYVTGFYHTHRSTGTPANDNNNNNMQHVREGLISGMQCCATSSVFTGETNTPLIDHQDECDEVEWWSFQDVLISEGWFSCPKGKFLKGFKVGLSFYHDGVHRIFKASCCRPQSAGDVYEHCYTDKSRKLDNTGVHTCRMEGYLVTAMYLNGCVEGGGCTENLTCCIEA